MDSNTIYNAYIVEEGKDEKSFWHKVGSAFPHIDGQGIDLVLPPGISVSGRITLRERKSDDDAVLESPA